MNPPKCTGNDFINFLIAAHDTCTCTEAARCLPVNKKPIAHDSLLRLLERQPHHTEALYNKAKKLIWHHKGFLVIDDSTLDKTYARYMSFVTRY